MRSVVLRDDRTERKKALQMAGTLDETTVDWKELRKADNLEHHSVEM